MLAGNDFSTLYAPLIRDGRMEKFYWNPTRADRIGVCKGIFKEDNLSQDEVEDLVDSFPGQTIDFFGCAARRLQRPVFSQDHRSEVEYCWSWAVSGCRRVLSSHYCPSGGKQCRVALGACAALLRRTC